jgi:hypothetical protein
MSGAVADQAQLQKIGGQQHLLFLRDSSVKTKKIPNGSPARGEVAFEVQYL